MSKLEDIGFYTLSEDRVKNVTADTPMWRCELIITDKCNFKCPYCRGLRKDCQETMPLKKVKRILDLWSKNGLKNIRFSGGEPTLHKDLPEIISYAKSKEINRIAISTNGSHDLEYYEKLCKLGVNDFSISLDACCSSFGKKMCGGIDGMWEKVVENIKSISKLSYVTLGLVFTEDTVKTAKDVIEFAHRLHVDDIRIISSAQYNKVSDRIKSIDKEILDTHPILKYRVNNYLKGRNVRGITSKDSKRCGLVLDDSCIAGNYHFPCVIYMREGGNPIGKINSHMRNDRVKWFKKHNTHKNPICKDNCLDVCIDYNNKYRKYHGEF